MRTWIPDDSLMSVNRPPSLRTTQERAAERGRRAVGPTEPGELETLYLVDVGRPGDVVGDEQVQVAVVVDVQERRPGEPSVGALGVGRPVTSSKCPLPSLRNRCPPPIAVT